MNREKISYSEQLKDPRWQMRKTEILNRDEYTCQLCGNKKNTLHVHHKRYIKNRLPWEYGDNDLITLCEKCHQNIHTKPNTDIAKIGEVYLYCHSDFDDYLMCFHIDYADESIYLGGMDNGSGSDNFWVFRMGYEEFYNSCRLCENFFNEEYSDDYRQQWVLGQYYYLLNDPNYLSLEYYCDIDAEKATRFNLDLIKLNNEKFAKLYEMALDDKYSIICI